MTSTSARRCWTGRASAPPSATSPSPPPAANLDGDGDLWDRPLDCDDTRSDIHPGATETCDGLDNNCNNQIDELMSCLEDNDSDGESPYTDDPDNDTGPSPDADDDGVTIADGDCDDDDPNVAPGLLDVVDGVDTDCDGVVDEGVEPIGTPLYLVDDVEIPDHKKAERGPDGVLHLLGADGLDVLYLRDEGTGWTIEPLPGLTHPAGLALHEDGTVTVAGSTVTAYVRIVTIQGGNPDLLWTVRGEPGEAWSAPELLDTLWGNSLVDPRRRGLCQLRRPRPGGLEGVLQQHLLRLGLRRFGGRAGQLGHLRALTPGADRTTRVAHAPDDTPFAAVLATNETVGGHLFTLDAVAATEVATFELDALYDLEFAANGDAVILGSLSAELVLLWWNGVTWATDGLGVTGSAPQLDVSANEAHVAFRTGSNTLEVYAGSQGNVDWIASFEPNGTGFTFDLCTDADGLGMTVSDGDGLWLYGL